jgi:predicted DNA-binding WGR domain protein
MKKHLKYIDGTSDKFWQIEVAHLKFTVTYGKNGTSGVSQVKEFANDDECLKLAEKLIAEKIKKGYSESGEVLVSAAAAKPRTSGNADGKTDGKTTEKVDKKAELQAVTDAFDGIIISKKISLLLPFLEQHAQGNREGLKLHIKKCKRYWMTYTDLSKDTTMGKILGNQWGTRGKPEQFNIITLAAIALFDKTDIASWSEVMGMLDKVETDKIVLNVLKWAKPNWISTFLLDSKRKSEWFSFDYEALRILEDNQLAEYNAELFSTCLATVNVYDYSDGKTRKVLDFIESLTGDKFPYYQRDILELFNYETNLHNHNYDEKGFIPNRNYNTDPPVMLSIWENVFTKLMAENKLDRAFFIENCLQIQTKEWNNNLKVFFRKRLEDLAISSAELCPYQETIFTFLHAAYPPIVSFGVDNIKQIYEEKAFNTASFLEWVSPTMMRSDCKAAIKMLLPMFEKISKGTPPDALGTSPYNREISALIADILVIPDMSLQEKAAKSLLKIAAKNDADLSEKLVLYAPQMQGNIKSILGSLMSEGAVFEAYTEGYETYEFAPQPTPFLTETVVLPTDWNDILFQFGKFISSSDVLDAEILLNTFVTQRHLFPADASEQLKPYFKQLESKYFDGVHKSILSAFLMQKIVNMATPFVHNRNHYNRVQTLGTFAHIVLKADKKIQSGSTLPLLSMPTHAPYWVAPKTLVERLIAHQNANEEIDRVDFSVAISRMPRENMDEVTTELLAQLEPELQKFMAFCLGSTREMTLTETSIFSKLMAFVGGNTQKTENVALWAVAARTFYPQETFKEFEHTYLKNVSFVASPFKLEPHFVERFNEWKNYQTKELERSPSWYELGFKSPTFQSPPPYLLYSLDIGQGKKDWENLLHCEENAFYWQSIMPQNSDALGFFLIKTVCALTDGASNELKGYLDIVGRPEFRFSDPTTLAFACCFFQEKKDIRFMATEVLINLIQNQNINTELFGEKLAFLISGKYGALLRFVDSIAGIKDVSALHNSALFQILDNVFKHLDVKEKLPTNFKKMVEHYVDAKAKTQHTPSEETVAFFDTLADNATLKSLLKQIRDPSV